MLRARDRRVQAWTGCDIHRWERGKKAVPPSFIPSFLSALNLALPAWLLFGGPPSSLHAARGSHLARRSAFLESPWHWRIHVVTQCAYILVYSFKNAQVAVDNK